jgi:hypothetical protein
MADKIGPKVIPEEQFNRNLGDPDALRDTDPESKTYGQVMNVLDPYGPGMVVEREVQRHRIDENTGEKVFTDLEGNPLGTTRVTDLSYMTPRQIYGMSGFRPDDPNDPNMDRFLGHERRLARQQTKFPGVVQVQGAPVPANIRQQVSDLFGGMALPDTITWEEIMELMDFYTQQTGQPPLQFLQHGGIITQPTTAIVGERGPEMVMGGAGNTNPRRTTQRQQAQAAGQGPQRQQAQAASQAPVGAGRQYSPIMQGDQRVGTRSTAAPFGPLQQQRFGQAAPGQPVYDAIPGANYAATPQQFLGIPGQMHGSTMGDAGQGQMYGQMDYGPLVAAQEAQRAAQAQAQQQMAQAAGMGPVGYGRQYSPMMSAGEQIGTQSRAAFGPYAMGPQAPGAVPPQTWYQPGGIYGSTPGQFLGMPSDPYLSGYGSSMTDTGQSQMRGQMDFGPMEQQMRLREQARQANQQQMMMGGNPLNMLPFAALAGGGQINQPMMALVGEQGPELAMLQPGDAIIPLAEGQAQQFAEIPGMIKAQDGLNVDFLAEKLSDPLYQSLFRNRMTGQYVDPNSVFPSSIQNPGFTLSLDDPKYDQLAAGYEKAYPDLVAQDFEFNRIPGQTPAQYLSDPLDEAVGAGFRLPTKEEYDTSVTKSKEASVQAEKEKEEQELADALALSQIVLPDISSINTESILVDASQGRFTPAMETELLSYVNQLTPMIANIQSDIQIQLAMTDPETGNLKNPEEVNRLNALLQEATTRLNTVQNTYTQATKYKTDWLSRQRSQTVSDTARADRIADADLQRELNQARLDQQMELEDQRYQREKQAAAPTSYSMQFLNFLAQQLTQSGNVPSQDVLQGLSLSEWLATLSAEEVQAVLASLSRGYGQGGNIGQFQPGSLRFA